MNYAEQANLLIKVKAVCESVNDERQLDTMKRYCSRASALMTYSDLGSEVLRLRHNAIQRFQPNQACWGESRLNEIAEKQRAMAMGPAFSGFGTLLGRPASPLSGLGLPYSGPYVL